MLTVGSSVLWLTQTFVAAGEILTHATILAYSRDRGALVDIAGTGCTRVALLAIAAVRETQRRAAAVVATRPRRTVIHSFALSTCVSWDAFTKKAVECAIQTARPTIFARVCSTSTLPVRGLTQCPDEP